MTDFDVIVVGGGINGLTVAAYLGKSGLKTAVVEARGECGAHCDSSEPGIPGFIYNLHATMLAPGFGPPMEDLDLPAHGLELRNTTYTWGKSFADGKNALIGTNPYDTIENWQKHSAKDAALLDTTLDWLYPHMVEFTELMHNFMYRAPSRDIMMGFTAFMDKFLAALNVGCTGSDFMEMNGFQILDRMFESEHLKTMIQSMGWIVGFPPIHKQIGSIGILLGLLSGSFFPLTTARGGSHALTHALTQVAVKNGVKFYTCCPVKKIIVENGAATGVVLADEAIYPGEHLTAKKIVSNLTVVPTFDKLIDSKHVDVTLLDRIRQFNYDEQTIFTVHYALDGAPQWQSAQFDPGIQKCWMGYFGGKDSAEMKEFSLKLLDYGIHDEILANWYTPTLADPTQAPDGCHVTQAWVDIPGAPRYWKGGRLDGFAAWDGIKQAIAEQITETYDRFAPGFKKQIKHRFVYTPQDQYRNNPSAIDGCWAGGSVIPEQFYDKRPVPGVLQGGGARTFVKNLYISNSIHPLGISVLSSGYIAACEVAEDMGVRQQTWWKSKATHWYLKNAGEIPLDLGVR